MYGPEVIGTSTSRWGRSARALVALVAVAAAREALAWQVFVQVTSEISFRGSSETTSATTRAENAERASRNRSPAGSMCTYDDECNGWCDGGTCADPTPPRSATTTSPAQTGCDSDQSCAPGFACRERACVGVPPSSCRAGDDSACAEGLRCRDGQCVEFVPLQPAPIESCTTSGQCLPGQSCLEGHCISPPPPPPSSSLWRRGSELYLRDRAVQLREDLALGEGPVISTLAVVHGVRAATLGRVLRAHRAELIELMGDGSDPGWTGRVLSRVEALCAQPIRLSAR